MKCLKGMNFYMIPVLNLFYDTLFDEPPSLAQMQGLMATFGLLNGLLFVVAATVANMFGPNDAETIFQRYELWKQDPGYKDLISKCASSLPCDDPYEDFQSTSSLAFISIGSAVIMLIIMYVFTAALRFKPSQNHPDLEDAYMKGPGYIAWWAWIKWLFLVMIALTAAGTFFCLVAVQGAAILQHGHTPQRVRDLTNRAVFVDVVLFAVVGVGTPLLLLSVGLIRREYSDGQGLWYRRENAWVRVM